MKKYKSLFEYQPDVIRAKNYFAKGGSKKQIELTFDKMSSEAKEEIIMLGKYTTVKINDKRALSTLGVFYRFVLWNNNIYSLGENEGIHQNIISWLVLYKNLPVTEDEYLHWNIITSMKTPFICLHQGYTDDDDRVGLFFSESYIGKKELLLSKLLNSKFKKEMNFLEKQGGIFINELF